MTFFLTYIVSVIICSFIFLALNTKYKWITKQDGKTQQDKIDLLGGVIVALIFWPLTLTAGIIYTLITYIWDEIIPKE
jgi:hypothetical protein